MRGILVTLLCCSASQAFLSHHNAPKHHKTLHSVAPDLFDMHVSQLREELEALGVSTKNFFEKKELIKALQAARKNSNNGKSPFGVEGFRHAGHRHVGGSPSFPTDWEDNKNGASKKDEMSMTEKVDIALLADPSADALTLLLKIADPTFHEVLEKPKRDKVFRKLKGMLHPDRVFVLV